MPQGKPQQVMAGTGPWRIWTHGETLRQVRGITPLVASWEANTHPAQVRLQRYLDDLQRALGSLPAGVPLSLHLDVDVERHERLLHQYDLENYLTPIVYRLGAARFVFVSARKYVGGGSRLSVGVAEPRRDGVARDGWGHFSCHAGSGATKKEWKAGIRDALLAARPLPLPPGPAAVHLAWRCGPYRNWTSLWKPTGDAMGPVLGEPDANRPFNPADDRIMFLALHLDADSALGHNVDVAMWWRPANESDNVPAYRANAPPTEMRPALRATPASTPARPPRTVARAPGAVDPQRGVLEWLRAWLRRRG